MRVGGRSAAVMNPLDKMKKEGRKELKKREERPMGGKQQEETRIEKAGRRRNKDESTIVSSKTNSTAK